MAAVVVGRIGSMEAEGLEARAFPEGSTVVRRDVSGGKVWTAAPYRVIGDTGTELTLACWPGVGMLAIFIAGGCGPGLVTAGTWRGMPLS